MKPFQIIFAFVLIILVGGIAALIWGRSVQDATVPVEVVEEPVVESTKDDLSPGSYLVFQSVEVADTGTEDWVNDDTETYTFYRLALGEATYRANLSVDELEVFATIEHGPEFSGSLIAYVYGQDLLLHRYSTDKQFDLETGRSGEGDEMDAILSLGGEITEVSPESWGRIRSENGTYEVTWGSVYDRDRENNVIVVTEVETGRILREVDQDDVFETPRFELEPFLISNSGERLFIRLTCACEGSFDELWMVDITTGEVSALHERVDMRSNRSVAIDPDESFLIAIDSETEPNSEGPGEFSVPPTQIRILDLESVTEVNLLIEDETRAWFGPWIDPTGEFRYVVGNDTGLYLMSFEDEPDGTEVIDEKAFITNGSFLDWVGDWLVVPVQKYDSVSIKLINLETREEVLIDLPGRSSYVGSITLE